MFFTKAASIIGRQSDHKSLLILIICLALLATITGLMLFFSFRYGKDRHPEAAQISGSALLETGWTAGAVAIVLVMFFLGWDVYASVRGDDAPPDAYEIKATAQMWAWSFEYPDGRRSGELGLPEGRPVKLTLTSTDVIHSFYLPAFRVKQDAVPGAQNTLWFVPDQKGVYEVLCTEYCGYGHSQMLTKAVVMGEKEFNDWSVEQTGARREAPAEPPATEENAAQTADGAAGGGTEDAGLAGKGEQLVKSKGCMACHSTDGSKKIGPTLKGLYGHKVKVTANGEEREVTADEEYLRKSLTEPNADVVAGFAPVMPKQNLKDDEIDAIIAYIKTLE